MRGLLSVGASEPTEHQGCRSARCGAGKPQLSVVCGLVLYAYCMQGSWGVVRRQGSSGCKQAFGVHKRTRRRRVAGFCSGCQGMDEGAGESKANH
jgi:hypothetical protein